MTDDREIQRFGDAEALARAAAASFAERARAAAEGGDDFRVALTGGGSPRRLYHLLGDEFAGAVPWDRVHLFWGDDRCVPPAHPRSNFAMADRLFLSRVPIPRENVHRIRGELPPAVAAREYRAELRAVFGTAPRFDLVHLGLGEDGHVASLFPFDLPRLLEREHWAVPSLRLPRGEPRVTLTLPVLNAAERVEFLLPSEEKHGVARRVVRGPLDPFRLPAQLIRPRGALVFLALDSVLPAR